MSSIRKRFERVKNYLDNGEGSIEDVMCDITAIEYILDATRGKDVPFRCCFESYERDGKYG